MGKNRIRLNICGAECVIGTEDNEEYVRSLGSGLEQMMKEMMGKNERVSLTMAAMIAALSYSDEMHRAKESADNLRSQIKDYLEDSSRARMEADEARREIERMKREIQTLRARLPAQEGEPAKKDDAHPQQRPAAQSAPVQRPQAEYARVPAAQAQPEKDDVLPGQEGFMSFFEKKSDEL